MGVTDRLFDPSAGLGETDALLVTRGGEVELECYRNGIDHSTTLPSWSMAKSMLHAAVGVLVEEGALDLDAPAPVPAWSAPGDSRGAVTLRDLMTMRAGLSWTEEPVGGELPDSVTLVYGNDGRAQPDTAAWAADRPLVHRPGSVLLYSSGSSAIVSGIVRDVVGAGDRYAAWLRSRLFDPVGMASARPRFDDAGTWLASSFCFCTARDFARFGKLYLDGGVVDGHRLLMAEWVATAATPTGTDGLGRIHTMHWWQLGVDPWGAFGASGYLGQHIIVVPPLDLVLVRLGRTPTDRRRHLTAALVDLIAAHG